MSATPSHKKNRLFGGGVIMCIALFFLLGFVYWATINAVTSPIEKITKAWSEALKEDVTIDGHTLVLQEKKINELAVIQQPSKVIIKYETTWLGSKKTIVVVGDFMAKAGFKLGEGFQIKLDENGAPTSDALKAEILSVEMLNYQIFHAEEGIINKLLPEDQERATNLLLKQAREDARNSNLKNQAEEIFFQRIEDLGGQRPQQKAEPTIVL